MSKQCYKCKKHLKNKTNVFVTFEDERKIYLCDDCLDKFVEMFLKSYADKMEEVIHGKK